MKNRFINSKNMAYLLKFRKEFMNVLEFIIILELLIVIIDFNIISVTSLLFSVICMIYLLLDKNKIFKIK